MIIIIATFAQALSGSAPAVGIVGALVIWRFIVSRHPFLLNSLPSHFVLRPVLALAAITL